MKNALLVLFAISVSGAFAQAPVLVSDMYPGATGSTPALTTVFNGKLYYTGSESTNGRELRAWDGFTVPSIVYNINPGVANAFYGTANDKKMAVLNGKLYFGANNGAIGHELWVYDGVNPPSVAADVVAGATGSDPYELVSNGSKILFNAHTAASGYELYVYDGVNPPTLFDINPGVDMSDPKGFTPFNGKIYFAAITATAGEELFVYDPSNNTAALAADIASGATYSSPRDFVVLGNKLYFSAYTAAFGRELYSYDGTTAVRLTDINPAAGASIGNAIGVYNNMIYFSGGATTVQWQLYKYDPGTNIASLVYNIYPGNNSDIANFIEYGNKLYFNAKTAGSGDELWVYDGNTPVMVADIEPGTGDSAPKEFVVFNGKLCFNAFTAATGAELYSFTDPNLGVQNIRMDGEALLTPNPTSGDATLQLSMNTAASLSIQLTDIGGKLIWNKETATYRPGKTDITIPVASLSAGTYFYRVAEAGGTLMASGKLVKE